MARDFPFSTASFIWTGVTTMPVSAYPFTMFARFNADSLADSNDSGGIIGLWKSGEANNQYVIYAGISGDSKLRATVSRAIGQATSWGTSNSISTGTWHSATLVIASATDKRLFLDATRTDNATSVAFPTNGFDHLTMGVWTGPQFPLDGKACEGALWNIALSNADVASLAKGYTPDQIRPDGLVGYWPVMGRSSPEPDRVGTLPLTIAGTPSQYPHPRVLRPRRSQLFVPTVAAPVTGRIMSSLVDAGGLAGRGGLAGQGGGLAA